MEISIRKIPGMDLVFEYGEAYAKQKYEKALDLNGKVLMQIADPAEKGRLYMDRIDICRKIPIKNCFEIEALYLVSIYYYKEAAKTNDHYNKVVTMSLQKLADYIYFLCDKYNDTYMIEYLERETNEYNRRIYLEKLFIQQIFINKYIEALKVVDTLIKIKSKRSLTRILFKACLCTFIIGKNEKISYYKSLDKNRQKNLFEFAEELIFIRIEDFDNFWSKFNKYQRNKFDFYESQLLKKIKEIIGRKIILKDPELIDIPYIERN